jgi:tRNA modification GTPase
MRALVALRAALPLLWRAPCRLPPPCRVFCSESTYDAGFTPSSASADTIFALSSGAGRAGVSVVRISGPRASDVFERMAPGRSGGVPEPRRAVLRKLCQPVPVGAPAGGELIDEVLALWFPGPRSFTGEDTVELHTHGSRAVVSATLDALGRLEGLRMAEAGEFTRQAFDNGRMELTQVEGLADLINADTEEQRKQALRQMGGAMRERYEGWRSDLLGALAHTEALIDFGEDAEDVTEEALAGALKTTRELRAQIEVQLADGGRGEVVREGVRVAILGPPNAGKSTLLNALAQRDAAIVSPVAGTTRDVVQVTLQLGGLPVLLSDTAGLREATDDPIEKQGMLRAADEARRANIQLWVFDAAAPPLSLSQLDATAALGTIESVGSKVAADDGASGDFEADADGGPTRLLVLNKIDLHPASPSNLVPDSAQWRVSCESGEGVQGFLDALASLVSSRYGSSEGEPALITRERHRAHLRACAAALGAFEEYAALGDHAPLDLAAEELRLSATELGRITGKIDVEEMLDVIFRDFCIGK